MQKYDIFCACNVTSIIILTRNQYLNGMRYRINLDIIHITLALYLQCLLQVSIDYVRLNGFVVTRLNLKWYEWRIAITNLFIKEVKEDQMLRSSHAKNIHFLPNVKILFQIKLFSYREKKCRVTETNEAWHEWWKSKIYVRLLSSINFMAKTFYVEHYWLIGIFFMILRIDLFHIK